MLCHNLCWCCTRRLYYGLEHVKCTQMVGLNDNHMVDGLTFDVISSHLAADRDPK